MGVAPDDGMMANKIAPWVCVREGRPFELTVA